MENFDVDGRILFKNIDQNGRLVLANQSYTVVPKSKVIFEEENIKMLPNNIIDTAALDPTNTRLRYNCKKCKDDVSIMIRKLNQTFYVCRSCKNVEIPQ
jgi:hypothetical protein